MNCTKRFLAGAAALAALVSTPLAADTLSVPDDYATIQEAIDATVKGDDVLVAPGNYPERIDLLGKAITVHSVGGPTVTTINGQSEGVVVTCSTGEGPATIIEGFTITGGLAPRGGGMRTSNTSPTVNNCVFVNNTAFDYGGGMSNIGGDPTVTNCTFDGNIAPESGGIDNESSDGIFIGCTVSGNTAAVGGGMGCFAGSDPMVSGCTFTGNHAGSTGGGLYSSNSSRPRVSDSTFCANTPEHIAGPWIDEGGNEFSKAVCCPADLDGNGTVDFGDIIRILTAWGDCPGCPEDLDGSGAVDFGDVIVVLTSWGPCGG